MNITVTGTGNVGGGLAGGWQKRSKRSADAANAARVRWDKREQAPDSERNRGFTQGPSA